MRQGLAAYRGTKPEDDVGLSLAVLAEAYGKAGQVEEGLAALAEALRLVDKNWRAFGTRRSCIGSRASSRSQKSESEVKKSEVKIRTSPIPNTQSPSRRPRSVFSKPSRLRGSNKPSRWNCARR